MNDDDGLYVMQWTDGFGHVMQKPFLVQQDAEKAARNLVDSMRVLFPNEEEVRVDVLKRIGSFSALGENYEKGLTCRK